jgi:L-gulonolactone oxidase
LSFAQPTTESGIINEILDAAAAGDQLRVVGAGHSFSGIQLIDNADESQASGRLLNLDRYTGITNVVWSDDKTSAQVTIKAGSRLRDVNTDLENLGLAFINLGSCAAQSIAGATSTGTHGTGRLLGNMATQITGLKIIDSFGQIHNVSQNDDDNGLFTTARVGLGALGVITEITVNTVPIFKLKETTYSMPLNDLLSQHDEIYNQYERFQWNWIPYSNTAGVILRENTDEDITGCGSWVIAEDNDDENNNNMITHNNDNNKEYNEFKVSSYDNTSCVDVSYKTMVETEAAYYERTLYTEMEMFIPVEYTVDAVNEFIAFQDSIRDQLPPGAENLLYCQVRYVAADDITLSPVRGRDVAVMSMIVMGDKNQTAPASLFALFAQGMENITTSSYNGVPHWGKKNWATASDLEAFYGEDALAAFESFRSVLDPTGMFLNDYLTTRGIGAMSSSMSTGV